MLRNLKVSTKLLLMVALVSVAPIFVLSVLNFSLAQQAVKKEVLSLNSLFAEEKKVRIEKFFEDLQSKLQVLAVDVGHVLSGAFLGSSSDSTQPEEEAVREDKGMLNETQHQLLDESLIPAVKSYGLEDIFITDEKGVTIYAAIDKKSVGDNRSDRKYIQRSLRGEVNWEVRYSTVYMKHVLVYSSPIYVGKKLLGTLNFVLPFTVLEDVVHEHLELIGKTADSFLIGPDGTLLTTTKYGELASKEAVLSKKVNYYAQQILAEKIQAGSKDYLGYGIYKDYRGVPVVGAFGVARLGNELVGVVVEQDQSEAFDNVYHLRNLSFLIGITVVVVGVLLGLLFARSISKPLAYASTVTKRIASGDLTEPIAKEFLAQKDEVGELLRSLEHMQASVRSIVSTISDSSKHVISSANFLSDSSGKMSSSINRVVSMVEEVDRATQNASASVEEVTSGVEEVSASAQNVAKASQDLSEKARRVESSARERCKSGQRYRRDHRTD